MNKSKLIQFDRNRPYNELVNEKCNEDCTSKDLAKAHTHIQIVLRFISHARDLEKVHIMIAVAEVIDTHGIVFSIGKDGHRKRPGG